MSEPPSASDSLPTDADSESTTGAKASNTTPYLLVLPTTDGGPPGMVWPGPEGTPGWAIPVTIPAGTRGYAVFVPLLPREAETGSAPTPKANTQADKKAPAASDPTSADSAATPPIVVPHQMLPHVEKPQQATPPPAPPPVPPPPATPPSAPQPLSDPPPASWSGVETSGPRTSPHAVRQPGYVAQPSFFQRRWPGPKDTRGREVPAAVLAGALGLAFFVPLGRTGIGWFLGWLTLTIGVVVGVRQPFADLPRGERWVRIGWAASALALMSVLAFRNAWWLVTFCVLGALACAALAIVGGRLVRSILFSLVAAPLAGFFGLPWVRRHITIPARPSVVRRLVWSVAVTAFVLIIFGTLLSSADAAFSVLLGKLVPEINTGKGTGSLFLFATGGLIAVAAVYTLSAPPDLSGFDKPGKHGLSVVEWGLPIGGLTLLFAGFVGVQFTVLFGGERHVLRTAGLSYAEYARSGFWQLVAVTLLTLGVLGAVTRWARREQPIERLLLRALLGLLSVLSVVIVISALSRMYAYQKVYSFTGERIFVMGFELLLGSIFVMIMLAGIRWRGAWIPRTTIALAVALLLSLAVLNPEDYAAERNIARYKQTGKIDAWYLRALSADATPALAKLPDPVRRCTLSWIDGKLDKDDPWYGWNLGRVRAREELKHVGPGAIGSQKDCRAVDRFDLPKTP